MAHKENLILLADAYKYSHHKLYYPGPTRIFSYLESRGGKFPETVFFGLQYYLKAYLEGPAFTQTDLDEAEMFLKNVYGRNDVFDKSKFQYILDNYGGHLPVRISAVPEGTSVPVSNVLMTIENTDPACYWLPNFLETLLMQIWYPATVASLSHEVMKVVKQYFEKTASASAQGSEVYVLNDFGFRGVSSVESAGLGGAAHLLSFLGSDNLAGSSYLARYYGAKRPYGLSIPATEHSIMTLRGKSGEAEIFEHILNTFPTGTVACVSDSYDIFKACKELWGGRFKEKILSREGTLVIRPDSGDPVRTLLAIFDILFEQFGFIVNEKGYKVLPSQVRVIQGDGINYDSIGEIYAAITGAGVSAENLFLGMGGGLLQKLDRDTQKFALKCSWAEVGKKEVDVMKNPMEMDENGQIGPSFKKSKAGRLKLVKTESGFSTVREEERLELANEMIPVFENGKILRDWHVDEIKARLACQGA